MRIANWLVSVLMILAAPASAPAQTATVPPFDSIALRDGGQVIVRHGAAQRVSFRQGNARDAAIGVADGRLTIRHCPGRCSRGERLIVEVVTPRLESVSVSDGGLIQVEPGFPAQDNVAAAVSSGGAIDLRAFPAANVAAAVAQGGLIFVRPRERLVASVVQGGGITYWGNPVVQSATRHGGVVARGDPADEERPIVDLHPSPPRLHAVPPVPPVPSLGN